MCSTKQQYNLTEKQTNCCFFLLLFFFYLPVCIFTHSYTPDTQFERVLLASISKQSFVCFAVLWLESDFDNIKAKSVLLDLSQGHTVTLAFCCLTAFNLNQLTLEEAKVSE